MSCSQRTDEAGCYRIELIFLSLKPNGAFFRSGEELKCAAH